MKPLLTSTILSIAILCSGATGKFPIFDGQALPRPANLRHVDAADFKIDLKRVEAKAGHGVYPDKAALFDLAEFYKDDPSGKETWIKMSETAAEIVNQWDFRRKGFGADRYVYRFGHIKQLALIHLFSGNRELGDFIRGHLLQVAELPFEFWLHSELRGYDPKHPRGMLETSSLCIAVSGALSLSDDILSPAEKTKVEKALREKGLIPCLNWMEKPQVNNFTAVISSGAYVAAKYFDDKTAMAKSIAVMRQYLDGSIEDDGSYGEGSGYFGYPIANVFNAFAVMDAKDRAETFAKSGLRRSAEWMAYPYFYFRDDDGLSPTMVHFGDNSFHGKPTAKVCVLLGSVYRDGLAVWLMDAFKAPLDWESRLVSFSSGEKLPAPLSPEKAGLPLMKCFDSGDNYIRSTWKEGGVLLALRSGDGSRIKFSHQRAELNSICMGAYGEYLVVSPGSASYRSPLHLSWDWATRSTNTICVDERNQLFPSHGLIPQWIKFDNSSFWEKGTPKAEIAATKSGKLADLMVCEAKGAYAPKMKRASRAVLFVREPGYFVIVDRLEAADATPRKYSWRVHLNNRDGHGELKELSSTSWLFSRPKASLLIDVGSEVQLESERAQGYMHGESRDYSPGGENEGKPGSSIEIAVWNKAKTPDLDLISVLFPLRRGAEAPRIAREKGALRVGEDLITLEGGKLSLTNSGRTEINELP